MKKLVKSIFYLFVLLQQSVFAEEILYDFDGLPTTFPTAVFGPPTASGHKSGILRFFPIRALDGDLLYHIHFEDVDILSQSRDGDLELYHHADAGGWFAESIDGKPFSLDQWMIERLFYSDDSGDIKPLVAFRCDPSQQDEKYVLLYPIRLREYSWQASCSV